MSACSIRSYEPENYAKRSTLENQRTRSRSETRAPMRRTPSESLRRPILPTKFAYHHGHEEHHQGHHGEHHEPIWPRMPHHYGHHGEHHDHEESEHEHRHHVPRSSILRHHVPRSSMLRQYGHNGHNGYTDDHQWVKEDRNGLGGPFTLYGSHHGRDGMSSYTHNPRHRDLTARRWN